MPRLWNPVFNGQIVESPVLKDEVRQLKDELVRFNGQLAKAHEELESERVKLADSDARLRHILEHTVPMSAHRELVDRHNEILREYGKLRSDYVKGSAHMERVRVTPAEEQKTTTIVDNVVHIKRVLDARLLAAVVAVSLFLGAAGSYFILTEKDSLGPVTTEVQTSIEGAKSGQRNIRNKP